MSANFKILNHVVKYWDLILFLIGLSFVTTGFAAAQGGGSGERKSQPTRLESILSERAGLPLRQFGYDQFGAGNPIHLSQIGGMQDDYVLGAGDEIVVSLRGQENAEYRATVDRDGRVVLPRVTPVTAGGRPFGEFRRDLMAMLGRIHASTEIIVSIGRVRQIRVLVTGEVNVAGAFALNGFATVVDAIFAAGGIKKAGSLRDVRIVRGGKSLSVDLYSVLMDAASGRPPTLVNGDRVIVPPIGASFAVGGDVKRQGIFELPRAGGALSLREALLMTGGTTVPEKYTVSLMRMMPNGTRQFVDVTDRLDGVIHDGDILLVKTAVDIAYGKVQLSGAVRTPGRFALGRYATLHDLIPSQDALRPDAYMLFGFIDRIDAKTMRHTLVPFSPLRVVQGRENLSLRSDDSVWVSDKRTLDAIVQDGLAQTIICWGDSLTAGTGSATPYPEFLTSASGYPTENHGVGGETSTQIKKRMLAEPRKFRNPVIIWAGRNNYFEPETVKRDIAEMVAALGHDRYLVLSVINGNYPSEFRGESDYAVIRSLNDDLAATYGDHFVDMRSFLVSQYNPQNPQDVIDHNNDIPPSSLRFDQIHLLAAGYKAVALMLQRNALETLMGGRAAAVGGDISDLSRELADIGQYVHPDTDGILGRRLTDYLVTLGGAVHQPGSYLVAPGTTLAELIVAANGLSDEVDLSSYELTSTSVNRDTGEETTTRNYYPASREELVSRVLMLKDIIVFHATYSNRQVGAVKIDGEVRRPGTYSLLRNERLSDLLRRAGGMTPNAFPYGAVFLRLSVAKNEAEENQRTAKQIEDQLVQSMTRLGADSQMSAGSYSALQGFVDQLRSQPALGRMVVVVDLEKIAQDKTLDTLLEPGDRLVIPVRPFSVSVMGEVVQPVNLPFNPDWSVSDYIKRAGGFAQIANKDEIIVVRPDGTTYKSRKSWFGFGRSDIPAGSMIYVGRDIFTYDNRQLMLDMTSIFSKFASTAAAMAVLIQNASN